MIAEVLLCPAGCTSWNRLEVVGKQIADAVGAKILEKARGTVERRSHSRP